MTPPDDTSPVDTPGPPTPPVGIGAVARRFGVSASHVRMLADSGRIPSTRTEGGHRRFDLDAVARAWPRSGAAVDHDTEVITRLLAPLDGLAEDAVWTDIAHLVVDRVNAVTRSTLHYVVTEMVNNAIDHSEGTRLELTIVELDSSTLRVSIVDDGIGVFRRLARGLGLESDLDAVGELSKGKRTTMPDRHTGEGIFFSSKATETFRLAANGLELAFDNVRDDFGVGASSVVVGTNVTFTAAMQGVVPLSEIFAEFSDDDAVFNRTRPRVKLFEHGDTFVSRSEAKRLADGIERFDEVEIDFTRVTEVGQGFADELFRVWATAHPSTRLVPVNMIEPVAFMIDRARRHRRDG